MPNIDRRRRWIEEIEGTLRSTFPYYANTIQEHYRKRLLSLLRRVRRCPECHGKKLIDEWLSGEYYGMIDCPTCGGTGRL